MKGCHWERQKRSDKTLQSLLREILYTPLWKVRSAGEHFLLNAIRSEKLFGVVECDIHCPDNLLEYFEEAPPLFVHFNIGKEHLSPEMLALAERDGLLKRPRKSLVSVRSGENVVVITPVLKWLLEKGLVCKKIHRIVEFKPFSYYKEFEKTVTQHRSAADKDPDRKAVGQLWKLVGNSCYGKTVERREKYTKTSFYDGLTAGRMVNLNNFRHLEPIEKFPDGGEVFEGEGETVYEIDTLPRRFKEKCPRFFGVFILGWAKLVLLRFYYDFLLKFWDKHHFELLYCDTDS